MRTLRAPHHEPYISCERAVLIVFTFEAYIPICVYINSTAGQKFYFRMQIRRAFTGYTRETYRWWLLWAHRIALQRTNVCRVGRAVYNAYNIARAPRREQRWRAREIESDSPRPLNVNIKHRGMYTGLCPPPPPCKWGHVREWVRRKWHFKNKK